MNADSKSAQDDIAFMKSLVDRSSQTPLTGASLMIAGGVIYGLECIGHWLDAAGIVPFSNAGRMWLAFGPTGLFLVALIWVLWQEHKRGGNKTVAARAISSAFTGVGIGNLALAFAFGMNAIRMETFTVWLFYPAVACALQGAGWFAFAFIRRRLWLGFVAAGWYVTAVATGLLVDSPADHLLILGIGLIAFLAIPGVVLVRLAHSKAATDAAATEGVRPTARADVAFIQAIVNEGDQMQSNSGFLLLIAGLLYGFQCVGHWLTVVGDFVTPGWVSAAIGFGPTVIFLVLIGWSSWRDRKQGFGKGVANRAIGAAFAGAGVANIALVIVFGVNAARMENFTIWLFYPVVVCALQGAVWFAFASIRRRLWLGAVAAGWYLAAIVCGYFILSPNDYLLALGISLLLFMAAPGAIMMRKPAEA